MRQRDIQKAAKRRAVIRAMQMNPVTESETWSRGRTTMRDVSEGAGVSISIVSHVQNNTRQTPEITRTRVVDAIKAVSYRRSPVASALKRAETRALGIAVGDIVNPHFTGIVDAIEEAARMATHALMAQDAPPTALFVADNLMTSEAAAALAEGGRRMPEDVALVSFDDLAWADLFSPRRTVAAQPCREVGEAAVRLLLEHLAYSGLRPPLTRRPVKIRHRELCGCAAGAAPIR